MTFLLALLLDTLFSEPPARIHPVCAMGRLANWSEKFFRAHCQNARMAGILATLSVLLPFSLVAFFFAWIAGWIGTSLCLWLCMAPRSLGQHAQNVAESLQAGQIAEARQALSMIVGRDVAYLDEAGIARAAVESVGENLTDGVLASIVWTALGLWLGGFPLAAICCVLHRASNTLDAMWGKKNERYLLFGAFAARLDDILGYLPARLSLFAIAFSALFCPQVHARESLQIGWEYRKAHESPNSAWSEAAFAGAIHIRLGGPAVYAGKIINHPFIGRGTEQAKAEHIHKAIRLMYLTTIFVTLFFSILF